MTDFYISAIRMDNTGQHIERVKTHKVTGNTFDSVGSDNSRKFVGELISTGKTSFTTITKNSSGQWQLGAKVEVMPDGYITTDPNKTKRDNLGQLPKF